MENSILRSFIEYPSDIESFLKICPFECFSPFGKFLLKNILDLREEGVLKIESLLLKIPEATQQKEPFLEFLSAEVNPNYINFAKNLLNASRLRKQQELGEKLIRASKDKTLLDLDALNKPLETSEVKNLSAWIEYYKDKPKPKVYPTKIPFLDMYLNGGIELAQLVLISGDPEAGKTRLCLQILENLAKENKVCFFCFEFTAEAYVRGMFDKDSKFRENFFIINDGYDIAQVANHIRTLYKQGVKFFLIDSQMRLSAPQGRNMEEEETAKFSTLAKLCHSLGVVVFLIVQTSKTDKDNPTGSKKGGHEASIILRIERCKPEKDDLLQKGNEYDENTRIFYIRKNKQTGKHPKEKVLFDTQSLRFKPFKENTPIVYEVSTEEIKSISAPII